jgi:hypothetical protein
VFSAIARLQLSSVRLDCVHQSSKTHPEAYVKPAGDAAYLRFGEVGNEPYPVSGMPELNRLSKAEKKPRLLRPPHLMRGKESLSSAFI